MASYVAIIHKDDVAAMAREALALHVKGMREDGEEIPTPSTLEQAMNHELAKDAVACLVVDLSEEQRTVRVNITLPENELKEIDAYARRAGLTRSSLLAMGARMMMHQNIQPDAAEPPTRRGKKPDSKKAQAAF